MLQTEGNPIIMGGGEGFGLGNGFGILALIIIAVMAFRNGFFGGNNNNGDNTAALIAALSNRGTTQYATSNEVQRGFDNQNTVANQREILSAITNGTAQSVAATNQSFHDMMAYNGDKYNELTRDIGALSVAQAQALANQNACCCETKMLISETGNNILAGIAQNRYEAAFNTAAIQKTIVEEAQKNRDLMTSNRMADLQNENNFLRTQNLLGNVVRYPTTMAYNAGTSPFCNCGNLGFAA